MNHPEPGKRAPLSSSSPISHEPSPAIAPEKLVFAPWTCKQVVALDKWQALEHVHPFTCGEDGCRKVLIAEHEGWHCPACDYTQNWAHAFMADERLHIPSPSSSLAASSSGAVPIPQMELPPEAAKILRDHAWELYDGQPVASSGAEAAQPTALREEWAYVREQGAGVTAVVERFVQKALAAASPQPPKHWEGLSEFLDLVRLMPDFQVDELLDFVQVLRQTRGTHQPSPQPTWEPMDLRVLLDLLEDIYGGHREQDSAESDWEYDHEGGEWRGDVPCAWCESAAPLIARLRQSLAPAPPSSSSVRSTAQMTPEQTKAADQFRKMFVPVTYALEPRDTLEVRMLKKIHNIAATAKHRGDGLTSDELRQIHSAAFAALDGPDPEFEPSSSSSTAGEKEQT